MIKIIVIKINKRFIFLTDTIIIRERKERTKKQLELINF